MPILAFTLICVVITSGANLDPRYGAEPGHDSTTTTVGTTTIPSIGNWYVNDTQVVQNQSITLNGNLSVGSTGNLTLRNVSLIFDSHYIDEDGIVVNPSGAMYVFNSTIAPANLSESVSFVEAGSAFVLDGSNLSGIGSCPLGEGMAQSCEFGGGEGLTVEAPGADVENTTFYEPAVGVALEAGSARIDNDDFLRDENAGIVAMDNQSLPYNTGNNTVIGNRFSIPIGDSGLPVEISLNDVSHNLVARNLFTDPSQEFGSTVDGDNALTLHNSWNNTIIDNNITANWGVWITYDSMNNNFSKNAVTFAQGGVVIQASADNKVTANIFNATGGNGVALYNAQNTTLADNTFLNETVNSGPTLFMVHSSATNISNNNASGFSEEPLVTDFGSVGDTFEGNTLLNQYTQCCGLPTPGLLLLDSSSTLVKDNSIGGAEAIELEDSGNNSLYDNNFDDLLYPSADSGGNSWDRAGIGNYWNDYVGSGPYQILPNGTDYFPQLNPVLIVPVPAPPAKYLPFPLPYNGSQYGGVITNTTVYDHMALDFPRGGFTVDAGGTLVFNDSTLNFGSSTQNGFSIAINPGGALVLSNCSGAWNSGSIEATGNGSIAILNSTLMVGSFAAFTVYYQEGPVDIDSSKILASQTGYGYFMSDSPPYGNLTIDQSDLENGTGNADSIVSVRAAGLSVNGSRIVGSPEGFDSNWDPSTVLSQRALVTNTTFIGNWLPGVFGPAGLAIFSNNTVIGSPEPTSVLGNVTIVDRNSVESGIGGGLQIGYSGQVQGLETNLGQANQNVVNSTFNYFDVGGDNITIEGNKIAGAGSGGLALEGSNDSVVGNTLSGDSQGTGLGIQGDNSTVFGNTAANYSAAVSISGNDNLVYHNNLINYSTAAMGIGQNNSFDLLGQGNYWSAYNGTDSNLDGIGDSSYSLGGGSVDYDPFIQPNGWQDQFYLTVETNLSGVPFALNGHIFAPDTGGVTQVLLGYHMNYTVRFPGIVPLSNVTRLAFTNWSGLPGNQTVRVFYLSSNSTIAANYTEQYLLTARSPVGSVTGSGWYSFDSTAHISFEPSSGYRFVRWIANTTAIVVGNPNDSSTTLTVRGPGTIVAVVALVTYNVTFVESGLPLGTSWSVSLGGVLSDSATTKVVILEPDGTFYFAVTPIVGYTITAPTGYVTVNGTNVTLAVVFSPILAEKYLVVFTESGLAPATNWSVTLNGTTDESGQSEIQFTEPNGSYPFAVGLSPAYTASPESGTVNVSEKAVNETITFSSICYGLNCPGKYLVTFTESGLPSGTMWSLTINGSSVTGTTSVLPTRLQNGTYPFTVGELAGYSASPQSGSVTVNGSGVGREITFTLTVTSKSNGSTPTLWGLSDVDGYILVGAIVAVALAGSAVTVMRRRRRKATPDAGSSVRPDQAPNQQKPAG